MFRSPFVLRCMYAHADKLMQQFEKKGYKIDTLTSVTKASLSNRKITYQEWLDLADGIHFSEGMKQKTKFQAFVAVSFMYVDIYIYIYIYIYL